MAKPGLTPSKVAALKVPFSATEQLLDSQPSGNSKLPVLVLPATYQDSKFNIHRVNDDDNSIATWAKQELSTARLDCIHDYLWLAGYTTSARSLHRQLLMSRSIVVTEQVDMHLVWRESRIFIKPLPAILLNYDFWEQHFLKNAPLHAMACGMLLSYAWLVCHESDFDIAQANRLLPRELTYRQWTIFANAFTSNIDFVTFDGVDRRYRFGELRLPRLNTIYRWTKPGHFVTGYFYDYYRYSSFFRHNFGWLFTIFAFATVVLGAMQVGLATKTLANNQTFVRVSYGFAIASIALVPAAVGAFTLLLAFFVINNAWVTVVFLHKKRQAWQARRSSAKATVSEHRVELSNLQRPSI